MIHAKYCKPRIFPWNSTREPEQIDRSQDIGGDLTLNREKQYEIGRDGILGYRKGTPAFAYSMRQFEYGQMGFWNSLVNKVNPVGSPYYVTLEDLKTPISDIAAFLTDDNGTFTGSIWFPKLRVNGFSINIGDPDAIVERNFDLVGEDYKILDGKYFAYEKATAVAPGVQTIVLDPVPVAYATDKYIFRVLRVRSGVVSELIEGIGTNQWQFTAPATVEINDGLTDDVHKVYYESATAYTTLWTNNNSDSDFLLAESCEISIKVGTGTRVYRLQSVGIDVAFERTDYKEIGNSEIVQTGVKSKTVTISLNRFSEDFSLEAILAGDTTFPYINPRDFVDNIQLMVKVFSDKTHTAFKIGYLMNNISPTTLATAQPVEDYQTRTNALECDNLKISDHESEIVFA